MEYIETFAPLARLDSFRMLMVLYATTGMNIEQLDLTTAYLNGDVDTLIYMEQSSFVVQTLTKMTNREVHENFVQKQNLCYHSCKTETKYANFKKLSTDYAKPGGNGMPS